MQRRVRCVAGLNVRASGDDIWDQEVLELFKLVLQEQFAFLETLDLERIERARTLKRCNRIIQITVLLHNRRQLLPDGVLVHTHTLTDLEKRNVYNMLIRHREAS